MDWIMPAMSLRIWDQHMTACEAAARNGSPMRLHFAARSERPAVAPEYGCRLYVRVNWDIVGYHDCMGINRRHDHKSDVPSGWQVLFDPAYHPITPAIPAPAGSACLRQAPADLADCAASRRSTVPVDTPSDPPAVSVPPSDPPPVAVCRAGAEGTARGPQSPPAVSVPPSAVPALADDSSAPGAGCARRPAHGAPHTIERTVN